MIVKNIVVHSSNNIFFLISADFITKMLLDYELYGETQANVPHVFRSLTR